MFATMESIRPCVLMSNNYSLISKRSGETTDEEDTGHQFPLFR